MKVYNKNDNIEKRKSLRRNQTEAEEILWKRLRGKRFMGLKFRRQHGIGEYIVDFYCPQRKLVIEVDGGQHYTKEGKEYDGIRERFMAELGIKTLRFGNNEVKEDIENVVERVKKELGKQISTSPVSPS